MKLIVKHNFLDRQLCTELGNSSAGLKNAHIVDKEGARFVNPSYRKTLVKAIAEDKEAALTYKILNVKEEVEQQFSCNTTGLCAFQLLRYEQGHFFKKHRDVNGYGANQKRKVTVLVYLNEPGQGQVTDCYQGGTLVVYGVHEGFEQRGLPIIARTGMLVAFPSDLIHEVTPITRGARKSIVTWFY